MFDRIFRSWKTSVVGGIFIFGFFVAWFGIWIEAKPFYESVAMLCIGLYLVATKDEAPAWIKGWIKK